MKRLSILLSLGFLLQASMQAQLLGSENSYLRKGNRAFEAGNYLTSADYYQQAVKENPNSHKGKFNLGDAYYNQKRYADAVQEFSKAVQMAENNEEKFKAWHNMGNALLEQSKNMPPSPTQEGEPSKGEVLNASIDAYKQALRLNPKDEDTRYNLAYAQQMMQQQQNQDQQGQDQDDQNQDQQQQNQDQQNQDQQNQDQQQQNQDQQAEQQQNQQQQAEQRNMSREEIERMLEALLYQEEKLQKDLQKKKIKVTKTKVEKDW